MADLGDISAFLKDGNVSDLDWLDVPEKEYQATETLPKQNLDIAPDLEALWDREGESPARIVPNRADVPKTMGDLSEAHGYLRAKPEEIRKVARLALMQSSDLGRLRDALRKRFDATSIREASRVIKEVVAERGLLGRYYIDAEDFPACATGSKGPAEFVRRFAATAPFVRAKLACGGCTHAKSNPTGGCNCAVFHKQIEVEVPYTDALATAVEKAQGAKGIDIQAVWLDNSPKLHDALPEDAKLIGKLGPNEKWVSKDGKWLYLVEPRTKKVLNVQQERRSPKGRIQAAFLGRVPRVAASFTGVPQAAPKVVVASESDLEATAEQAKEQDKAEQEKVATFQARPIVALLQREMLKGRSEDELRFALKTAFQEGLLKETASHWMPLLKQAGIYGTVYITQDSFADCHEGADFISKHNASVRAVVKGSKCASCIYAKVGRCMIYGKRLVPNASEVLTPETVTAVLHEHKAAGRIAPWDNREWGGTPSEALVSIHRVATSQALLQTGGRMDVLTAFQGQAQEYAPNAITRRNIVKAAREGMNEGLYGTDLLDVLKGRFEVRDIKAAAEALRPVLAEQGLQGIHFVDPTVYDDYGKGCDRAASLHRTRLVPYLKVGEKCASCVLQTKPGFCSKIHKPLVIEPPYTNKVAQQREILASGRSTEVSYADLVNNGRSMMAEYEIQQRSMDVEVDPVIEMHPPVTVSFK